MILVAAIYNNGNTQSGVPSYDGSAAAERGGGVLRVFVHHSAWRQWRLRRRARARHHRVLFFVSRYWSEVRPPPPKISSRPVVLIHLLLASPFPNLLPHRLPSPLSALHCTGRSRCPTDHCLLLLLVSSRCSATLPALEALARAIGKRTRILHYPHAR